MEAVKALGLSRAKALGLSGEKNGINEIYEVKSIKITTPLEDGSSNDNKKIKTQKGMIYGKNYTFEVAEYIGKRAKELTSINWEVTYTDADTGEIVNLPISARGENNSTDERTGFMWEIFVYSCIYKG